MAGSDVSYGYFLTGLSSAENSDMCRWIESLFLLSGLITSQSYFRIGDIYVEVDQIGDWCCFVWRTDICM